MSFSELISPLIGRGLLAWFFLSSAIGIMGDFEGQAQVMTIKHLPVPQLLLVATLMVLILGGLSLLIGFHTRAGALLLFAFTLIASMVMLDFWHVADPIGRNDEYDLFARNVAIAGGLLLLVGMGPGAFAVDNSLAPKKR